MLTVEILKKEASELETELAQFEPKRRRLTLLKELIRTYDPSETGQTLFELVIPAAKRFANIGTTDAIKKFLAEKPLEFFSPRDIAKGMMDGGHNSASPNFFNIVYTICKRKAESGEFEMLERGGKKVFRQNQNTLST